MENLLSITRIEDGRDESADLAAADGRNDRRSTASCQPEKLRTHHHNTVWGQILLVNVDARLVMQVVVNLVDNAIKYTPVGSVIRISASGKTIRS